MLEGQNPTHVFDIPGQYTGSLYVYTLTGNFGKADFAVNVSGVAMSNGADDNKQPGFEVILVIAAIAIAVIILRRNK